jgi:hypothetical protein
MARRKLIHQALDMMLDAQKKLDKLKSAKIRDGEAIADAARNAVNCTAIYETELERWLS